MKPVKDTVYEFIQQYIYSDPSNEQGIETKIIADALNMQRSNVSTILNKLVSEEKLVKTNTRPVMYKLFESNKTTSEGKEHEVIIGHNGSLRNAIQLMKAAVLYPSRKLNILISSKPGCGTTYFAKIIYHFAIHQQKIIKDAPFVKVNCRHYSKNVASLDEELFGVQNCFERARNGILFIDYFDILNAKQQSRILTYLETGSLVLDDGSSRNYQDVYLVLSCSPQNTEALNRRIPVTIELPELSERPLQERFEFINRFFEVEAQNSKRAIEVTSEAIKALLLSEFTYNVKELSREVMSACANAYVRVVNDLNKNIYVCTNDFSPRIKRSLLKLKDHYQELDAILGSREYVLYDQDLGYQEKPDGRNFYINIQNQYEELTNRGINPTSVESVINNHIKSLFNRFSYKYEDESNSYEQLSKIVDMKVIQLVSKFIDGYKMNTGKEVRSNIFYALCLHIGSLMNKSLTHQRVSNDQIVMTIQNYPKEYAAAAQFGSELKKELGLELDIAEIVIITMFLIEPEENEDDIKPVLLYIMHGSGTAQSLCDVTNALTHCNNAYAYDLSLDSDTRVAMEEIKDLIKKIDRGAGVFVIYDMGSIKTMIDTISDEIDVKIRFMNIPITLIGIDIARKCSMENDIDSIYHSTNMDIQNTFAQSQNNIHNNAIITLCHTGEGGAVQLKNYIDQYSKLGMKTVAMNISDRNELVREVMNLKRTYNIHAFVGTYDPKLLGIPFIPISTVFTCDKNHLDRVLQFEPIITPSIDYSQVYNRLEEQLKYASVSKLKTTLPGIIDELTIMYGLNVDQTLGIFVHIACVVERILSGGKTHKVEESEKIILALEDDYRAVTKTLKRLEKAFKIIIDDHEIATIIKILKQI